MKGIIETLRGEKVGKAFNVFRGNLYLDRTVVSFGYPTNFTKNFIFNLNENKFKNILKA